MTLASFRLCLAGLGIVLIVLLLWWFFEWIEDERHKERDREDRS